LSSKIIRLLRKIYNTSYTTIRLQEEQSDRIEITEGLLQGETLSPLLFSLYISDIEDVLKEFGVSGIDISVRLTLHILMFADDMVLLAQSPKALQMKIKRLERYFDNLGLKVNLSKTQVVIFNRGGRLKNVQFKYKTELIKIVNEYTYLGVKFSNRIVFSKEAQCARVRGLKALNSVNNLMWGGRVEDMDAQQTLFNTIVSSTTMYMAHIWGLRYHDIINS